MDLHLNVGLSWICGFAFERFIVDLRLNVSRGYVVECQVCRMLVFVRSYIAYSLLNVYRGFVDLLSIVYRGFAFNSISWICF